MSKYKEHVYLAGKHLVLVIESKGILICCISEASSVYGTLSSGAPDSMVGNLGRPRPGEGLNRPISDTRGSHPPSLGSALGADSRDVSSKMRFFFLFLYFTFSITMYPSTPSSASTLARGSHHTVVRFMSSVSLLSCLLHPSAPPPPAPHPRPPELSACSPPVCLYVHKG